MSKEKQAYDIQIVNRKAKFLYFFEQTFEAGIQLMGTEIKSIREGQVNLNDAYCVFQGTELIIRSLYIAEYKFGNQFNHEPRRPRKLLLKRTELSKLQKKVKEKGYTIIPYKLFVNDRGLAKIEIALVRGKKSFDKRESIKEKDVKRDLQRAEKYD
jgi:SsrA-binding protein